MRPKNYKKKLYLFCVYFVFVYALFAITNSQNVAFLSSVGYNPSQRAYIISLGAILGFTLQIISGYLSDKYHSIKNIIFPSFLIFTISIYLFYSTKSKVFIFHFLTMGISTAIYNTITSLNDAWVIESGTYFKNNYGLIRGLGSLGWVIGSLLVAFILKNYGFQGVARIIICIAIVILFTVFFISDKISFDKTKNVERKDVIELFLDRKYVLAIIILLLFKSITTIDNIVIIDKLLEIGGTSTHIALRASIAAFMEIPFFLLGDKIYEKLDNFSLLYIAAFFYIISHLIMGFTTDPKFIVATALLQGLCFSPYFLASKHLLFELSPPHLKSVGTMTANAIFVVFSGFVLPIILGYISTFFSVNISVYMGSLFAVFAVLFIIKLKKLT